MKHEQEKENEWGVLLILPAFTKESADAISDELVPLVKNYSCTFAVCSMNFLKLLQAIIDGTIAMGASEVNFDKTASSEAREYIEHLKRQGKAPDN